MNTPYDFNYHGPVVVFDLDDTLLRERDYCRSGFCLIEQDLISRYPSMQGIASRMENLLNHRSDYFAMLEDALAPFLPDALSLKEEMGRLVALYRNHTPEQLAYTPGAEDTLRKLQRHGVVMALITDGRSGTQRCKIAALRLERYIRDADIFISEETGADKTRPDNFQSIVRRYPEASRFIYIADNPLKDFLIPNMLGWHTCQVPYDADNVHPAPQTVAPEYAATRQLAEFGEVEALAGVK